MKIFIILRNSYKQNAIKLIADWDLIVIPKQKRKKEIEGELRVRGRETERE